MTEFFDGIFLVKCFWRKFFLEDFFGRIFLEDFFGRIIWRIFGEEFFVYIGIDLFVKILVFIQILSQWRRKKEGILDP